jgi:hypothetical protein
VLALHRDRDREVDVGEQADRGPAVPGFPADDLSGVQAGALLGELMIFLASGSHYAGQVAIPCGYMSSACARTVIGLSVSSSWWEGGVATVPAKPARARRRLSPVVAVMRRWCR